MENRRGWYLKARVFEAHSWEKIFLPFTLGWWMVTHEDVYNEIRPRGRDKSVWCAEDISNGSRDPTMAFKFYEGGSEKWLEEWYGRGSVEGVTVFGTMFYGFGG